MHGARLLYGHDLVSAVAQLDISSAYGNPQTKDDFTRAVRGLDRGGQMPRGMTESELSQLGRLGAHSRAHREASTILIGSGRRCY